MKFLYGFGTVAGLSLIGAEGETIVNTLMVSGLGLFCMIFFGALFVAEIEEQEMRKWR